MKGRTGLHQNEYIAFATFISDNIDTRTYYKGNLFCLPPGEPQHRRPISVKDLKDEHPLAVDTHHNACLRPLFRKHPMEMDAILRQPLAHLKKKSRQSIKLYNNEIEGRDRNDFSRQSIIEDFSCREEVFQ